MSPIGSVWTSAANAAFEEMRQVILADPCLRLYDHRKLLVLHTNFSADGFGYATCQPADNIVSLTAMHCCMCRDGFNFLTKTLLAVLHPVAFGCRRTHGNETKSHSHLGEGFAGELWSTIHLGHRLLCNQVHPILRWEESLLPMPANAVYVLGYGH